MGGVPLSTLRANGLFTDGTGGEASDGAGYMGPSQFDLWVDYLTAPELQWGAIALAQNVEYQKGNLYGVGFTNHMKSREEAIQEALKMCETDGKPCEVKTVFGGHCLAFALDLQKMRYGWAVGTPETVERSSLLACNTLGYGAGCRVVYGDCSLEELKTN